ncbi:hypothetical protein B4079_2079 [Bacillus cereus]|uniref:Uncharacterized protein n=1 Tax=Bacillus pacificus TaxID=2026187 RepID=A0ABX6I336_9BACI|nr:hypothetical protein AT277_17825 [Bacillus cereus]QHH89201.1 hypothetical protein FPL01_10865 [Bacillus pacificus]KXZ00760.1 hypothetical protein AT276_09075 [Bacillus cereus]KYQ02626.1 hypothetical protein B4079_2079 [Bacillus cereus]PEB06147.1 hypothetical protein COM56_12190 [Bacillus cereus]
MNYVIFEAIYPKNRIGILIRLYKCSFYNNYDFLILLKGYDYFLLHVAIYNEKPVNDLIKTYIGKIRKERKRLSYK